MTSEENSFTSGREWTFNLVVLHPVLSHEFLAITGGCKSLGNWQHSNSVIMDRQECNEKWTATVTIPRNKKLLYRYFVCVVDPKTKSITIRRWETHQDPRVIDECDGQVQTQDVFGSVNGTEKIERGWLTTETIVQLQLFNNPFVFQKGQEDCVVWIKVTPKRIKFHQDGSIITCVDSIYAFAEAVRYEYGTSTIQPQKEFGVPFAGGDVVIFHITVHNLKQFAYLMEFFCWEPGQKNDPPTCIGANYIFPSDLSGSTGQLDLPILNARNKYPSGIVHIQYLVVTPMTPSIKQNLKYSFSRQWSNSWIGLDIGHRGSGASYSFDDTDIPENTIGSIRNAGNNGADMVEFDVHLTKDLVPVVYHDFHVNVSLRGTTPMDESDLIAVPIKDLTWEQLKSSEIYHMTKGVVRQIPPFRYGGSGAILCRADEYTLFPSLEKLFDTIDPSLGFDVELKWPQELITGTMEARQTIDKNLFVDKILEVLLRKGHGRRYVMLSSFDVDICTMLRFKQNIYPVMLLTLGASERYIQYRDPRCSSIVKAVCNAQAMELLGVILHAEDLLKDASIACIPKRMSQVVFCWGNDTREAQNLAALKRSPGLDGIIYDKCDILSGKFAKENDFRAEVKFYLDKLLKT